MRTPPLDEPEITRALASLPGWSRQGDSLAKTFTFKNFREAMAFMVRVSYEAEALDHHPDWTNVYRTVAVRLNTHDAGGKITAKDMELAKRFEAVFRT